MVLSPVQQPDALQENVLARLKGVRTSLHGWVACCPAHSDREPSLSIGLGDEGQVLLTCFAGCSLDMIVEAMGITVADLFPTAPSASDSQSGQTQRNVLTLVDLASDKLLHWKYLLHLGVTEQRAGCLQIPYHLPDGTPAPRHRLRTALVAKEGSHWSKGSGEIVPYGLERLEEARKAGYLVIVEGESDCWTLWYHHFPALGLPGVEMVRTLKEAYLAGIDTLYIVREPDAAGARFVTHLQQRLQAWKWPGKAYIVSLGDAKDPNELHKKNWKGFKAAFQQALDRAQPLLASMTTVPTSISFELRWPRLDQGGLTHLEEYLMAHPEVRLVVIDTWARVSPKAQHRQRSQYEDEYAALTPLKYLADTYRVSILAIHHLRKMRGEDVLDEITGSIGLTGAVDGALIIKRERGQHEASLFVTGRDIEHEQQLVLRFDPLTAMWTLVGNAEEAKRTKERQEILDLLSEQFPEGMTPRQVAEALDKNYHTARCLLRKMEAVGEIQHTDSQYIAIPRDNSGNQSDYTDDRNQRNQSVSTTLQRDDQGARGEESCLPATDYGDYTDYAHERVSANVFQTHSIPPPFGGCSLQFPSASEDVLSQREDMQDAQDDRNGGVINCNQCNQSLSVTTQTRKHVEQSSANTDYGDYADYANDIDYADYANESVSAYWPQTHEPDPSPAGSSIQYLPEAGDLLTEKEDIQNAQDQQVDYDDSVINRNQRNQSDLQHSQTTLRVEQRESNTALHSNGASAEKARASPYAPDKKRCPHHPHARWIRFDPAGQAWCDKMDCWDCYRLMKIGEALDYQPLAKYTRGIVKLEQGREAWSSFVTSQGSFAVLTATQYAIDLCKALGIEVPDLSSDVKRLMLARE